MSDSQASIFYMPKPRKKHGVVKLPAKYGIIFDNKEVCHLNAMSDHIQGLTEAQNKITAILNAEYQVCGYQVSSNHPATIIGTNVLMSNTVYQAVLTQKYMAQLYLIKDGVNPEYVETIGVEHCELQAVTLTYCLKYESAKDAISLLKKLKQYAGIVLKSPKNQREKVSKKIGVAATGDNQSWYINKVDKRSVLFYVKDRHQPRKFSSFPSPEVESAIYELGQHVLRVEINLSSKYLAAHGLEKPEAWRGAKGHEIYEREFNWLRSLLKVDADHRINKPQQRHIDCLSERDQLVLAWYLKGKPVSQYPQIKSGEWKKSPIKQRIQERLRIDIDIPWKTHCRIAIPGLGNLLSLERLVEPPQELLEHCHVHSTVKRKNQELRKLVEAEIAAAKAAWKKKGRGNGKGKRDAAGSDTVASFPVSALEAVLEALRKAGVLMRSPSDGTTSDVSDLMG